MQGSSDEVEGHRSRYRGLSDEEEVEGHGLRYKGRDADGNEFDIPSDRIISVTMPDGEEVEGHAFKGHLDQEPEVEGHWVRVKFTNDAGEEQEVEGHALRYSDLRLKRDVEPLQDVLTRLQHIGAASR